MSFKWGLAKVLLVLLLFCPLVVYGGTADDAYDLGVKLFEQGKYSEAVRWFDEAIRLNPKFTEAYNNRGLAYYGLKRYKEAIRDFNKSIHIDPTSVDRDCDVNLDRWLYCNNPRVIAYLNTLSISDVDKLLKGVILTDSTMELAGVTYLGRVKNVPNGVHIFLFKQGKDSVAYLWVDKVGKEFDLPNCHGHSRLIRSLKVLSGDVYTWKAAQPGHGIIRIPCFADSWKL